MHLFQKPVRLMTGLVFVICLVITRHYSYSNFVRYPTQAGGHDEGLQPHSFASFRKGSRGSVENGLGSLRSITTINDVSRSHVNSFNPSGSTDSRVLVIPCLNEMETGWVKTELPDVELAAYVVNNTDATLHPPRNKGHEVIVYLSYIIDHYANLPDVVIFMHAHRWALHNNMLLDYDAVQMIKRLSSQHVLRQGYVNLRCKWDPGCPEWLHPSNKQETPIHQEEMMVSKSWAELFPLEALPPFLAQTCCAQFALSKERIHSISLSRFIYYRDWILTTPLSDYVSGRIWEYSWQFLFTGNASYCPTEHHCHCETYGICFDGEGAYEDFKHLNREKENLESQLEGSTEAIGAIPQSEEKNDGSFATNGSSSLKDHIQVLNNKLAESKMVAFKKGDEHRHQVGILN